MPVHQQSDAVAVLCHLLAEASQRFAAVWRIHKHHTCPLAFWRQAIILLCETLRRNLERSDVCRSSAWVCVEWSQFVNDPPWRVPLVGRYYLDMLLSFIHCSSFYVYSPFLQSVCSARCAPRMMRSQVCDRKVGILR